MKLSITSVLIAVLAPAIAYRFETYTDETGKRRLKSIPKNVIKAGRRLQAADTPNMPAGWVDKTRWTEKYCVSYDILASKEDIESSELNNTVGATFSFPIYFRNNTETPIGSFVDATTDLGDDLDRCVFNGAFNFGELNDQGFYNNQLTLTGTCTGESNIITGGSGDFACASGYEYFTDDGPPGYLAFTAFYCSGCEY